MPEGYKTIFDKPSEAIPGTVPVSNTVPQSGTVLETGTETVPETGTGTVPETGTSIYIGIVKEVIKETSSSQNYSLLAQKLSSLGVPVDDDAAQKIIKRCRNADSTATLEEISHFTELKVQQLAKRKNIENWPGMLISAVPAYFDGEATEVRKYRADKLIQGRETTEMQALAAEHRRQQEQILADPDASEEDKQWARRLLSEEGN
jgi:viroplasmin and RNaseH domain-containing protein